MTTALAKSLWTGVGTLVLGTEPILRVRVGRCLMAGAVYLICVLAEGLNVAFGFGDPIEVAWLVCYMLAGPSIFLVLIRSGWTRHMRDPALTIPQTVYAVSALLLAYPVNGPTRGLNLLLVALLPIFGFLSISQRQARIFGLANVGVFGAMMLALAWFYPDRFDPRVEVMHFLTAAICLPGIAVLLGEIGAMRNRLLAQKADLQQALARIEAIATLDELTGLVNRRHMSTLIAEEVQRRARQGAPFCLVLVDLDHFKRINDTYGHGQGDEALRRFAMLASLKLPEVHVMARWGGEEFLLLMTGTSAQAAAGMLQQLRAHMADSAMWRDCPQLQIRFSAGLAEDHGGSLSEILERADQALYRAKAEGRDRCVVAGS